MRDKAEYPRISLRSILITVTSVGFLLGVFTNFSDFIGVFEAVGIYVVGWLVPSASIGYDQDPSRDGIRKGMLVGIAICLLTLLILEIFLPKVQ